MKVRVTKEFAWAPDGNHVRYVKPGEVLEGRGAEVALEARSGEAITEAAASPSVASGDGNAGSSLRGEPSEATASAAEPAPSEQRAGFSTADIGRKKRPGR